MTSSYLLAGVDHGGGVPQSRRVLTQDYRGKIEIAERRKKIEFRAAVTVIGDFDAAVHGPLERLR